MPAASDRRLGLGRIVPILLIGLALLALAEVGRPGAIEEWAELRGSVPGTGGLLAKRHLIVVALLAFLVEVLRHLPREGGPIASEEGPEDTPPQ